MAEIQDSQLIHSANLGVIHVLAEVRNNERASLVPHGMLLEVKKNTELL